jgi:hypothetical protein
MKGHKQMKTITKSARLSMKTKTNTLLEVVLFLFVTLQNITRSLATLRLRGPETRKPIAAGRFKLTAVVLLLTVALPITAQPSNFQAVFSSDFNTGIPPQVTGPATLVDVYGWNGLGASGYVFDGSMLWNTSGEPTRVTLTGLPAHSSVQIGFLLALIDSWDGIGDGNGPDSFNVNVDGVSVFSHVFNATGGISDYIPPPGVLLSSGTQLGFGSGQFFDRDQAYDMSLEPAFFDIPHSATTLTVEFFASGPVWQGGNDESWAIDQL